MLADAGYVSYRRLGVDRYEIEGHRYVGRARFDDLEVQVGEKVPGTLLALVRAAAGTQFRIERMHSPATDFDLVSRQLMAEFTRAAGKYIADRRKARYEYRDAASPVLAGSLDMTRTMRLHATGRLGFFAYQEGRLVRNEPLDQLVLAGLESLDRTAVDLGLDGRTLYEARWLAGALDEVRDASFLAMSTSELLTLEHDIRRSPTVTPIDLDLARLAVVALLHKGFEFESWREEEIPRACFFDLEKLFEQAVCTTLSELFRDTTVDRGEGYERRMFRGGSDTSCTNPDLVVHRDRHVLAVGDVKYKSLTSGAGGLRSEEGTRNPKTKEKRPDLYQVLVHAASLDAGLAFLIYPGDDTYASRYLGRSATGCRTWTAQVRPTLLTKDLETFIAESGIGRGD
jgi:hypothetical protein